MSSDVHTGPPRHAPPAGGSLRIAARLLAAAGLAVDAWVHAGLADRYDGISASVSQGDLFRLEAGLAALAALLVLVWRRLPGDVFAFAVAAVGLALVLVYRYADIGQLGPAPDMYEPFWYGDKTLSAVSQAVATVATGLLLLTARRGRGDGGGMPRT